MVTVGKPRLTCTDAQHGHRQPLALAGPTVGKVRAEPKGKHHDQQLLHRKAMTLQEALSRAISVQLARLHRSRNWLADELGMSAGSLSSRLTGRTMLDTEDIDAIAGVLGMTGWDLLVQSLAGHVGALRRRLGE